MKEPPAKAIVEQKKRPTTAPNNNLRNGINVFFSNLRVGHPCTPGYV